jgi:hypothetical protein
MIISLTDGIIKYLRYNSKDLRLKPVLRDLDQQRAAFTPLGKCLIPDNRFGGTPDRGGWADWVSNHSETGLLSD